ncbi:hypothetical protein K6U06_22180 [Acidiferrimicrobium sp. IK]|uniref:hypothetical protein n=1 Tax=Acidiferrimicrobium sp. IK TaxID=2871700 RepID=UPI0021CB7402|nr:hypothetical protein [Acidiferrimicrobium sp. IK]MCU4187088.1 hypothetical protein [Acidiferrimicrobium sp. IK]
MASYPDYRLDPSPTPEGAGAARERWEHFHFELARDDMEEAYHRHPDPSATTLDPDARDDLFEAVAEESQLLGFWLAWQRAGGFANLEHAGWNRATIYRRIRRFRATFGVHPDQYQPDWISLDLHKVWGDRIRRRLQPDIEPDEP